MLKIQLDLIGQLYQEEDQDQSQYTNCEDLQEFHCDVSVNDSHEYLSTLPVLT